MQMWSTKGTFGLKVREDTNVQWRQTTYLSFLLLLQARNKKKNEVSQLTVGYRCKCGESGRASKHDPRLDIFWKCWMWNIKLIHENMIFKHNLIRECAKTKHTYIRVKTMSFPNCWWNLPDKYLKLLCFG